MSKSRPKQMQQVLLAVLGACLLTACATRPTRAPLPAAERGAALAAQQQREAALATQPQWQLQGRVGLSNGERGGSGRIEWQQDDANYSVALSAPITRQSWRVSGDGTSVRLEGLKGGTRTGNDAGVLLRESTGWEIPVAALSSWVRGARARREGVAQLQFSADGRLARLQQGGWTLDYDDWRADPGLGIELPGRVNAQHDQARVRLVVDTWNPDPATP